MKSFLTKVGALLMTVVFAFSGCQDYDEDIRKVNEQLNTNTAELTKITEQLEAAIEKLEGDVAANYATKQALAALSAELKAEIDADVAAAKTALEAALATAQATLKSGYEAADAALKTELQKAISDAQAAANKAMQDLQTSLETAKTQLSNQIQTGLAEANAYTQMIEQYVVAEFEKINKSITALNTSVAELEEAYKAADAGLQKNIDAAIAKAAADLASAKTELTAAYEAAIKTAVDQLTVKIDANTAAIAALTQLHKSDIALLQAAMAEGDEALRAQFMVALNDHIDEYEATIANLENVVTTNEGEIAMLKVNLQQHIQVYEATVAQLQGAFAEGDEELRRVLTMAIEELQTLHENDIKNLENVITENAALTEQNRALLLSHIEEYETTISQIEDIVTANEGEIAMLKVRALALEAQVEALQALHETDINNIQDVLNILDAALQQETAQRKEADEELQAMINTLDAALAAHIEEYKATIANLENITSANEGEIAMLKVRLQQHIDEYEATVDLLQGAIAEGDEAVRQQAMNAINTLREEYEETVAQLEGAIGENASEISFLKGKYTTFYNEYVSTVESICALIDENTQAIYKAQNEIVKIKEINDTQDKAIEDLGKQLETLRKELKEYYALKTDVTTTKEQLNALSAKVAQLEKDAMAKISDLNTTVTNLETTLKEAIEALKERTSKLEESVTALLGRVQKIVYLPDYADGKANITYATFNDEVIEAQSELRYRVYPAEAAAAIAKSVESLSMNLKGVTTRAAKEPVVNVVAASATEDGILTVTVQPRNLVSDFYTKPGVSGEESYSVALVLANGNDNYSTEYTNLWPVNNRKVISFCIVDGEGKMVEQPDGNQRTPSEKFEIPYTKTDMVVTLMKGHQLMFSEDGGATYPFTLKQFTEKGYGFKITPFGPNTYVPSPGNKDAFIYTRIEAETVADYSVQLNPEQVAPTNVNTKLNFTYCYYLETPLTAVSQSTLSQVVIVKEPLSFDLGSQTATWEYAKDINADAYAFDSTRPEATYNREFANLTADVDNAASGVTLANLAGKTPSTLNVYEVVEGVDGAEDVKTLVTEPVVTIAYDAESKAAVTATNFAWGKTYAVEATYDLEYSTVTVKFGFNTVDRKRSAVHIAVSGVTEFDLTKDLVAAGEEFGYTGQLPMVLRMIQVLDNSVADTDYLKENFETEGKYPTMAGRFVRLNDEAETPYITTENASTGLHFSTESYKTLVPRIHYKNFNGKIETDLVYVAEVTTWYGQVVKISRQVKINLPVYDYVHESLWVKADADKFYSQVMGKYVDSHGLADINTTSLQEFSADLVDMTRAFKVADKDAKKLTEAQIEAAGLVRKFSLESTNYGAGIKFENPDGGLVLQYNDKDEYVDVTAELRLVNTNGSYVVLPTSFDGEGAYANYYVKKCNPIGKLVAGEHTEKIIDVKVYEIPVLKYFKLMDNRNGAQKNYSLIDNAKNDWVIGDDNNGFAQGLTGVDIYGLAFDWSDVEIPAALKDVVAFDKATRTLTFDNTKTISLFEDVKVEIKLNVTHTWGTDSATFVVTFPKNA